MPLRTYLAESIPLEHGIATTDKNEQYCVALHHGCSWFVKICPGDNRESRYTSKQLGKRVLQFWTHSYILTASYLPWTRISIYREKFNSSCRNFLSQTSRVLPTRACQVVTDRSASSSSLICQHSLFPSGCGNQGLMSLAIPQQLVYGDVVLKYYLSAYGTLD